VDTIFCSTFFKSGKSGLIYFYYYNINKMFSHKINNPRPKNFATTKGYCAIPIGHRCTSALACKYSNIRNFSLPFDWIIPSFPNKIQKVLENNFSNFIPDVHNNIFFNKYGINFTHFNSDKNAGIKEYERRIIRFNTVINDTNKKKYFVYINEDYLYNEKYREDKFNDNIFYEILELERFLNEKYINIDYNILFFNFKEHHIPPNSKIINIILNTTTLYNNHDDSPYGEFRKYCGKVLSLLFNTKFNVEHNSNIHNE
jgi:hypothetical protein